MTKEFILNTLLPYKEDPSTCATNEQGGCEYLTKDGRKCAVGKHLIDGIHQNSGKFVGELFSCYNPDDILTEEAKEQQVPIDVWATMQLYHDNIAGKSDKTTLNEVVEMLQHKTGFEFPELMFN